MIDTPEVARTQAQTTAVVRLRVPRSEIQKVMDPAIREVIATLAGQGIEPTGPLFSYHRRMDPNVFDFEVGFPVSTPVGPTGRVVGSVLPAATVARTTYRGPYVGIGSGWGELIDWVKREGHETAEGYLERYLAGPEVGPDASKWRTELSRTLATGD